jgi:hypothetical protein
MANLLLLWIVGVALLGLCAVAWLAHEVGEHDPFDIGH